MKAAPKPLRLVLAVSSFLLWTAWAFWANSTHYYDAKAMERELAMVLPANVVPSLGPADGGFPVVHMQYDFSRNDQLTIHEFSKDKLGLNVLLCGLATIATVILVIRTTSVSRSTFVTASLLALPLCAAYALFGLHPLTIAYAYFLPLVVIFGATIKDLFRKSDQKNETN